MRISCPGCGRKVVDGKCPNCGTPPMSSQLKWALLAFVAIVVLAALSLTGGPPIDSGAKQKTAAPAPAKAP